jgi:group I intron endonuclease
MEQVSCIYKISSISMPERFYIGSAVVFSRRSYRHKSELKTGKHPNIKMQRHFSKYGISDFKIEIVEIVTDVNRLLEREQYYIDALSPFFNLSPTAGNALGVKHSEESKRRRSIQRKGMKYSEDAIKNMSIAQRGNKNNLGKRHTESAKQSIGSASSLRNKSINNPAYKGCVQVFKDERLVGEYISASECAKQLSLRIPSISACLNGRRNKTGGYTFKRISLNSTNIN